MEKLVWNEKLNIGVEVIDKAHAELFRIVGKMIELVEDGTHRQTACKEGLRYLEEYTMKHFSEEEAYMRSIHYRGYAEHKKVHDHFREQTLVSFRKSLEASGYTKVAVERFLGVLLGWLTGHTMTEDQEIAGKLSSPKSFVQPSEPSAEIEADLVAKAVGQAMQDVFRLNADLVNASYNGRSMGMSFYSRLCYDIEGGGKVQLLFGVEEQLIRRGVGLLFGLPAMQDTAMVQEVSLQIFEQFLHHMRKLFQPDTTYQLCKAERLTRDEFRSDFMTRYPYHMLFETRLGHFAFCARTWQVKKRKHPTRRFPTAYPDRI